MLYQSKEEVIKLIKRYSETRCLRDELSLEINKIYHQVTEHLRFKAKPGDYIRVDNMLVVIKDNGAWDMEKLEELPE